MNNSRAVIIWPGSPTKSGCTWREHCRRIINCHFFTGAAWFQARIGHDNQKKNDWNEFSVNLGKPGHPMHETLAWVKNKYNAQYDDPSIDGVFKAIEWDEGRIPK